MQVFLRFIVLTFFLTCFLAGKGQGRIVINEFMSWSGCSTSNEFIELMNFGPGPMDIGCSVVTNGKYAVTIPPNTILDPGEFFLISGADYLAKNCGNTDSLVSVDLNWSTCNCTNTQIPTTGDGFLANGGNSNEKIVLFNSRQVVIDAISRLSVVSPSTNITTSNLNGLCSSFSFNLDSMQISYESINISSGIDNSFARKLDGDCGWVKTTAISADAQNKTGSTSSASYNFSTLSASECNGTTGSISIHVETSDVQALFPMTYTLAFDSDSNNIFDGSDLYTFGVDSTSPRIDLANLAYGRYRITVGSSSGCNLQTFDFFIFNCYGVILPHNQLRLNYEKTISGFDFFSIDFSPIQPCKTITLEYGDGKYFVPIKSLQVSKMEGTGTLTIQVPASAFSFFRLKVTDYINREYFSKPIKIQRTGSSNFQIWPNPVDNSFIVKLNSNISQKTYYTIYSSAGRTISKSEVSIIEGTNIISVPSNHLSQGLYYFVIEGIGNSKYLRFSFIKK